MLTQSGPAPSVPIPAPSFPSMMMLARMEMSMRGDKRA